MIADHDRIEYPEMAIALVARNCNLDQHGTLQMKLYENRSETPNKLAALNRVSTARSLIETADWDQLDQRLDEELKDTFPASDALSITRNSSGW